MNDTLMLNTNKKKQNNNLDVIISSLSQVFQVTARQLKSKVLLLQNVPVYNQQGLDLR